MRYVAFLRAINVGGHVVKMDRLRKIFESMRLRSVETFIASGNVIFEAAGDARALERRIEKGLASALGYEVEVFLRSADEIATIAAHEPFEGSDGCTLYVVFLRDPPDAAARRQFGALRLDDDGLHINRREVYWLCRAGRLSESVVAVPLGKMVGKGGTMRNVTTVRKLAAKYGTGATKARKT